MRKNRIYIILIFVGAVNLVTSGLLVAEEGSSGFEYESFGRRDPFVPLAGLPGGASGGGARGVLSINDISLQGIVMSAGGKREVIINGEIMTEGQKKGQITIEKIEDNIVTIKIGDQSFKKKLYKE